LPTNTDGLGKISHISANRPILETEQDTALLAGVTMEVVVSRSVMFSIEPCHFWWSWV